MPDRDRPTMAQPSDLELVAIDQIRPHPHNPRTHPAKQINRLAGSIKAFGFRVPVLIDGNSRLIAGHARVKAAQRLGMTEIPAIRVEGLTDAQVRALMIADNRLTEAAEWDDRLLAENLKILTEYELGFDLEVVGFDYGEIEQLVAGLEPGDGPDSADELPAPAKVPLVTRPGDLWRFGEGPRAHSVFCGDCREPASYDVVLGDRKAAMVITDPPYNLPATSIGNVCRKTHGDFAMAAGEMPSEEFIGFLRHIMAMLAARSRSGAIHFIFMDHRHASEILAASHAVRHEFKNLCVWVKDRAGMGTFYRSQHELIFVFKSGSAKHQNNFELGQHGRHRSNVWHYPSVHSFDARDGDPAGDALALHPTVKPVRLLEDAILDVSRRGEIVLDPFMGSGSTLIACQKARRVCAGIELEPKYVDVAIARWRAWTGCDPALCGDEMGYAQVAAARGIRLDTEADNG